MTYFAAHEYLTEEMLNHVGDETVPQLLGMMLMDVQQKATEQQHVLDWTTFSFTADPEDETSRLHKVVAFRLKMEGNPA